MKKRWLVGLSAVAMSIALCMGIAACNNGSNDADIVTDVIDTLTVMYEGGSNVTNNDYQLFGQVKQGSGWYDVAWSASSDAVSDITQYVTFGKVDETTRQLTVSIKRSTEQDIPYTLTATVTVGKASESVKFDRTIQKKSSEDSITASLDLSAAANRTTLDTDNNEQVWQQNGVTLTNSGNLADYIPIRLYRNTTVKIEMENAKIIHIDFHSAQGYDDSPYPEYLKTSIESSDLPIKGEVAVSEDGLTISVDFETPLDVVTFKTTAGQCRLTSIDVEAIERDPDEHVHNWTSYQHVEGTWTHTATCSAEGCDVNTKTEACTPKLNVCECGYTYSAKEIVDALFALEKDQSLPGTYSLTGVVTAITEAYSTQYKNVTFEMTVEGQTVTAYRVKGNYATEVEVGGTATVNGELLDYGGKKEFTAGGSVVAFVPGVDERTPQQKVADALSDLSDTFIVTKAGETELPASTEKDVTFTWATENKTYTITGNKINVASLPAEDVTVTATVTATCGTEAVTDNTKTVTITIKAKGEEPTPGSGDGTVDHPYSVAEATEIIAGLGTETVYKVNGEIALVYVKGIVTVKGTTDSYGIKNYFMADVAGDTENDISVYSLNWGTVKQGTEINVGDTIIVTGYLQNFNGTYEVSSYKDTSWHNGTVEAHTPVGGTVTPPTPSDADATLSFATETARQSQTKEEQVWLANGITFTNTKSKSVNDVANFVNPVRCYPSSIVKIEFTSNITKIVFYSEANDTQDTKASKQYFDSLKESLEACEGVTVTVDAEKTTVTVVLTTPASSFEFTATRQVRFYSIDVYAGGGTTTPKTDAEKLAEAKAALKLSKTELTSLDDEVALPATQGEASVSYELQGTTDLVKIEGGKLIVLKLPETDTEIVIKATLTVGKETDNVDLKVTVKAESTQPQPGETLELTRETLFAGITGTGYSPYNGKHTVGGAEVTTSNVLGTDNYYDGSSNLPFGFTVLQFKKTDGTLSLKGTFTKIVVVIATSYAYDSADKLAITAGSTTLTAGNHTEADANFTQGNYSWKFYTIEYDVTTTGEQTITFKGAAHAVYVKSITLTGTASQGGEEPPVEEGVLYTLSTLEQTGSSNAYAGNCDVEVDGITWNIEGNSQQKPWRFGGKSITDQDRKLTGKTAIKGTVKSVVIEFGSANITVNSVTFNVFTSDPTVAGAQPSSSQEVTFSANGTATVSAPEEGWTDCFYQVVFNVTESDGSNKYVTISTMKFYSTPAPAAAAAAVAPVALLPEKKN